MLREPRLDEGPAQVAGAVTGERAAPVGVSGLVDFRTESGVADESLRSGEPCDVADLGGDGVAERPGNAGGCFKAARRG
jgi:hypothetical protein